MSNEDYKKIPIQVRQLVGFSKENGYKKKEIRSNNKKQQAMELIYPAWFAAQDDYYSKDHYIVQALAYALKNAIQDETVNEIEPVKDKVNKGTGVAFGNKTDVKRTRSLSRRIQR
mmetsp:Transcript_9004/g.10532  ORF Transcript_9004/g.10532 Transcript_9004/m.10532 type:complete len:115 (-) Transcript_9004:604-948(-)|eukprot:CAMPEP_0170785618 /NCGR_PEP_ID=MMETSP0733-20121128/17051_1 /TAXON_ID=186038 /ORGANISM="Fragilariopsis kerguelensis, Strain L26-C5" /LENGTH=114 /DNA_ID=CAMNT_0011131181 /DNA_START=1089 /DNA_END=1433 /DNA_ORIENTATION=+